MDYSGFMVVLFIVGLYFTVLNILHNEESIRHKKFNSTCFQLDRSCSLHDECCSNYCYKTAILWPYGYCENFTKLKSMELSNTANPVKVNGCKDFEDNSCVDDSDCCSLYCLKQFNNNIGVCKHPDKSRPNLYFESGLCTYHKGDTVTADGETYDELELTAAHKTLPLGTIVKIEYGDEEYIDVRINDRGPFVAGSILDVSLGAAIQMGFINQGVIPCRITIVNDYGTANSSSTTIKNDKKKRVNCKDLWDNTCKIHTDCCSNFCYRKVGWAYGVCNPIKK